MEKESSFPVYGEVWALFRFKGEQTWLNSGCLCFPCAWYEKAEIWKFCSSYIRDINSLNRSCDFEFAVRVGNHIFLLVEQDGKFGLPVELVD